MLPNEPQNPGLNKPGEELAKRLRDAMRRQRPRQVGPFFLALLLLVPILGLPLWWFWPRTAPLELLVIGFDQVTPPAKAVTVRVATEPRPASPYPIPNAWGGRTLFLQEIAQGGTVGNKPIALQTNELGIAETAWTMKDGASVIEIEAVYIDDNMRPRWFDRSAIRVFTWPSNARLLVFDVEPTLKTAEDWAALAKALTEAVAAGWQVAYLGTSADTPLGYAGLRNYVLQQVSSSEHALPNGPVLSRAKLGQSVPDAMATKVTLATLKTQFSGLTIHVVSNQGLQLNTIAANGDVDGDVITVPTWADLVHKLPR